MKMKIEDIIGEHGMDYITAGNLNIERITEISFEDAMCLPGRGICIDKDQDIYTNDLPLEERKEAISMIFGR